MSGSSNASGGATQAFLAVAIGFFGATLGYVIGARQAGPPSAAVVTTLPPAPIASAPAPAALGNSTQIAAYRNILAADPKNVTAAIQLGNLLYDAGRYADAVPYYRQALALDPKNVNVSTDLGTALWYGGNADEALKQYGVSLGINPKHEPTLFNVGVVRLEGKQDVIGAIDAWQRLIAINPTGEQASKARQRLEDAKRSLVAVSTTRPAGTR
jgi:tetratricopeptide (TPR) repeat protein